MCWMTMTLHLKSDQFTINRARVVPVFLGQNASGFDGQDWPIVDNVISDLPQLRPGPLGLSLFDCTVKSRRTGIVRQVPVVSVSGVLRAEDCESADASIELSRSAFLRVVLAPTVQPIERDCCNIGIATAQGTIEAQLAPGQTLDLLVPVGPVTAYICEGRVSKKTDIVVDGSDEDAGILTLM